jgi:DNA repair exonuclease SbcCD ATPase subunit
MITPKVKEIEEKFTNNKPLSQDDINTLLLKSQYNHINHLDQKLNEVVDDVASLKSDFKLLEQKVEQRFETFEQRFETLEQRTEQQFKTFEQRFETFEQKIDSTIQKALNKNMMLLVTVMGIFLLLSKIIDKF